MLKEKKTLELSSHPGKEDQFELTLFCTTIRCFFEVYDVCVSEPLNEFKGVMARWTHPVRWSGTAALFRSQQALRRCNHDDVAKQKEDEFVHAECAEFAGQ